MKELIPNEIDRSAQKKAQMLLRERYYVRTDPYKRFIEKKAKDSGCSFQEAATTLIEYVQQHDDDGTAQMLIRAALCELQK